MDFSGVGDFLIENGLSLLGGVIGGPAGAGVGKLIASAIGSDSDDPKDIMATLNGNPEAMSALRALQENHRHELESLQLHAQIQNAAHVNVTMQAEIKSSDRFISRARPSLIWAVSASVVLEIMVGGAIVLLKPEHMNDFVALCSAIAIPQSVAGAMCGVYMKQRSNDKALSAGHKPSPGLLAGLIAKTS